MKNIIFSKLQNSLDKNYLLQNSFFLVSIYFFKVFTLITLQRNCNLKKSKKIKKMVYVSIFKEKLFFNLFIYLLLINSSAYINVVKK
jgi:hypothetical protein